MGAFLGAQKNKRAARVLTSNQPRKRRAVSENERNTTRGGSIPQRGRGARFFSTSGRHQHPRCERFKRAPLETRDFRAHPCGPSRTTASRDGGARAPLRPGRSMLGRYGHPGRRGARKRQDSAQARPRACKGRGISPSRLHDVGSTVREPSRRWSARTAHGQRQERALPFHGSRWGWTSCV